MAEKTAATPIGEFFRFKIGDVVQYISTRRTPPGRATDDETTKAMRAIWRKDDHRNVLVITERHVQECPGGFQPQYGVRSANVDGGFAERGTMVHEFEVKAIEAEPDPATA